MVPLAQDDKGHPNKVGHLSPAHYVDSTAHQPAYLEMTQNGVLLEMVCLDCCLLKPDSKNLNGIVPPVPEYPIGDPEALSSVPGVQWERFSVYGDPVLCILTKKNRDFENCFTSRIVTGKARSTPQPGPPSPREFIELY